MEQAFDAYHKWLGIPPECQPPHHYRLLGLQPFESDPDVIQAAADQRMMHLRAYQTGKHSEWSQRLLNEVAAAKVCLLNAAKKAAYDLELRKTLTGGASDVQLAAAQPSLPTLSLVPELLAKPPRVPVSLRARRARRFPIGVVVGLLLAVIALLMYLIVSHGVLPHDQSPEDSGQETEIASSQPLTHGKAQNQPPNVGKAIEASPKASESPRNGHRASTGSPPPKDLSKKDPSRPSFWDPLPQTAENRETGMNSPREKRAPPDKASPGEHPDKAPPEKAPREETPPKKSPEKVRPKKTPPDEAMLDKVAENEESSPEAGGRAAEPAAEAQEEALKRARNQYRSELTKARTPDEKQALARRLLDQAEKTNGDGTDAFALFRLARDVAVEGLDAVTAFAAVDAAAERYQVGVAGMKMELLAVFVKKSHLPPPQRLLLAEQASRLMADTADVQTSKDLARFVDVAKLAKNFGRQAGDKTLVSRADACLRECQLAGGGQVDGPDRAAIAKRLVELARSEQDSSLGAAAARPAVRIKKWFSLLLSPSDLVGWETEKCHVTYANGVIELREGEMFCPIVTRDATIRAQVKCSSSSEVRLLIRNSKKGCYAARISNGVLAIVKRNRSAASRRVDESASSQPDEDVLARFNLPRRPRVLEFTFGFSAVGDVLTAFVNGQPVVQAKDATFAEGTVGIGTYHTNDLFVRDVMMLIHSKASLVADGRTTAANRPSPAKAP
jgi:hypothetical protein